MSVKVTKTQWDPESLTLSVRCEGVVTGEVKGWLKEEGPGRVKFGVEMPQEMVEKLTEPMLGALVQKLALKAVGAKWGWEWKGEVICPQKTRGFLNFLKVVRLLKERTELSLGQAKQLAELIEVVGCLNWEELHRLKKAALAWEELQKLKKAALADEDQFGGSFRMSWEKAVEVVRRDVEEIG